MNRETIFLLSTLYALRAMEPGVELLRHGPGLWSFMYPSTISDEERDRLDAYLERRTMIEPEGWASYMFEPRGWKAL